MNEHEAKRLEQDARAALEHATLTPQQQNALARSRAAALQQEPHAASSRWHAPWLGGALAASLALGLLLWLPLQPSEDSAHPADTFIALSELDETEYLIVEDMDFAYWLLSETELAAETDNG